MASAPPGVLRDESATFTRSAGRALSVASPPGTAGNLTPVKVLALDYGAARTGVAVSDATGTLARPVGVVERAGTQAGLARVAAIVRAEEPDRVVVGLPLTLRGEHGQQARETERFVEALRAAIEVPVESFDERFTTAIAARDGGGAPEDARAAAHLLSSYLEWSSARRP